MIPEVSDRGAATGSAATESCPGRRSRAYSNANVGWSKQDPAARIEDDGCPR